MAIPKQRAAGASSSSGDVNMFEWKEEDEQYYSEDGLRVNAEIEEAARSIIQSGGIISSSPEVDDTTTSGFVSDDDDEFTDAQDNAIEIIRGELNEVQVLANRNDGLCFGNKPSTSTSDLKVVGVAEADSSSVSNNHNGQAAAAAASFGIRQYQVLMAERAIRENIIVCLPTGSGKTVVGLKVMLAYKEQVRQGKKIFFFANTVPLLKQQASVIQRCTHYRIQKVYSYGKHTWTSKFPEIAPSADVFVIIPAIFKQLLDHGILSFEDAALFVIDECHNATKADAMCMIMRRYQQVRASNVGIQLPRVLGLTATILKRNLDASKVECGIKLVERLLCCTAVTCDEQHKAAVLSNSTKASIQKIFHEDEEITENCRRYLDLIDHAVDLLMRSLEEIAPGLDWFLSMSQTILERQREKDERELRHLLLRQLADLKSILSSIDRLFRSSNLHKYMVSLLQKLMFMSYREIKPVETYEEMKLGLKPKTLELLTILSSYKHNLNDMCGIVFVDRRCETQCLGALLDELGKKFPEEWGFIKTGVVVGTHKNKAEAPKYRQSVRSQNEVLQSFREGTTNLLIATSVLQEGIDVRDCSFVIRFDIVKQYPSFIQSMGRARKANAIYYVLLPQNCWNNENQMINKFDCVKRRIDDVLHLQGKNPQLLDDVEIDEADMRTEENIQNLDTVRLCPNDSLLSPMITLHASIMIVHRYCTALKNHIPERDRRNMDFRALHYMQRVARGMNVEDVDNDLYQVYVKMPERGFVTGVIEGPPVKGKLMAKRAAYLTVCQRLFEAGAMDEKLMPQIKRDHVIL